MDKKRPDFGSEEEREGPTADRKAKLRIPSTKNGHIKERKKTPEPCSYIEKSETHRLGGETAESSDLRFIDNLDS
jgi:hypothetical protein